MGLTPPQLFTNPAEAVRANRERYMRGFLLSAQENLEQGNKELAQSMFATLAAFPVAKYQARAALIGLAELKSPKLIEHALGYLGEPGIRETAVDTLRSADIPEISGALEKAYPLAGPANKAVLLQILAVRKAEGVVALLQAARTDPAPEVRVAALDLLGESPTVEDVRAVALGGVPWLREPAAVRYLTLAKAKQEAGDAEAARTMYEEVAGAALPLAVVAKAFEGIAGIGSVASRPLVEKMLSAVRATERSGETYPVELADAIGRAFVAVVAAQGDRETAKTELLKVIESAPRQEVVRYAIEKLRSLGYETRRIPQKQGFLTDWQLLGPIPSRENGAFGKSFFNESLAPLPEHVTVGDTTLSWKSAQTDSLPGVVDLKAQFSPNEEVAAYASATIACTQDTRVVLRIGTNDGYELWLNGVKLNENPEGRVLQVDQDKVEATLQAGTNTLLLKVLQRAGGWEFCVRLTTPDGAPIDVGTLEQPPTASPAAPPPNPQLRADNALLKPRGHDGTGVFTSRPNICVILSGAKNLAQKQPCTEQHSRPRSKALALNMRHFDPRFFAPLRMTHEARSSRSDGDFCYTLLVSG
jgi:hypothetical protein